MGLAGEAGAGWPRRASSRHSAGRPTILGPLVPIILFLVIGTVITSFSPLGRAMARRMDSQRGEPGDYAGAAELEELREEVGHLREELGEVQERLDFTERLLARAREKGLLGPGGGA